MRVGTLCGAQTHGDKRLGSAICACQRRAYRHQIRRTSAIDSDNTETVPFAGVNRANLGGPCISLWLGGWHRSASAACCNHTVAIDPEHGYVDGCTDVMMQEQAGHRGHGHHRWSGTSSWRLPPKTCAAAHAGYLVPDVLPSVDGQKGYTDVVMTVDGEKLVLPKGFYYMDCPDTFAIDETTIGAEMRGRCV